MWWLFLCCSKWEWELSVARKVEGRWQKLIPIYSSFWEKGPADFPLFPPSADKILFWSWCVNTLEFAREQLQQTSCFRFLKAQGIAAWQFCTLSPSVFLPPICLWDSRAQFASLWSLSCWASSLEEAVVVAKILQRAIKVLPTVGAEAGKLSGSCLLLSCQAGSSLGRCSGGEGSTQEKEPDRSASVLL